MAQKNKVKVKKKKHVENDEDRDPYTGELKRPIEDADKFIEVVPTEPTERKRKGENYLLKEETSMDSYAADADAEAVAEQSARYTDDEDIKSDFAERQKLASSGRREMKEELEAHHSRSPKLSGGDLDANWQTAEEAGEETVGGSVVTPDQDVVDELGEAAGLVYQDEEPLDGDKVRERDLHRWELNPASADEEYQESAEPEEEIEGEVIEDEEDKE